MFLFFILFELFLLLISYNIFFNKSISKNIFKLFIASIILTILFSYSSKFNNIIGLIFLFYFQVWIISKIDKKNISISLFENFFQLLIFVTYNLILYSLSQNFLSSINLTLTNFILLTSIFLVFIIYYLTKQFNFALDIIFDKYKLFFILSLNILIFLILTIAFIEGKLFRNPYISFVSIFITLLLLNLIYLKGNHNQRTKKEHFFDENKEFKNIPKELIENIKANEHEYKNHLNTLYSMIDLSDNDNLKIKCSNYIKTLKEKNNFSSLLYVDNPIIASIVYTFALKCEEHNIKFHYEITTNFSTLVIKDCDLSILLNNLLNNAFEAAVNSKDKKIILKISEDHKHKIYIENSFKDYPPNEIFKKGISSKGSTRGYGLYNVKRIIESHNGLIELSIENFSFKISLFF